MELTQRIKERLREVEDWNAVVDQLEAEAGAIADKAAQSAAYFELARACEDVFLDKAKAMQCYQKAFKLDQSNLKALGRARMIYQEMAHLEMVTRLMGLELKANQDTSLAPALNYAYGAAQLNLRQIDKARSFLEAAATSEPQNDTYQARFQETLYDRAHWQVGFENIYSQLRALTGVDDPLAAKVKKRGEQLSALYLRAARILQQEAPEDPRLLPLLFKALDSNPRNEEAGFLAETMLADAGQLQHIQKLQDRRASLVDDIAEKVDLLRKFAMTWLVRLNNPEMAVYFFHQALDIAYGVPEFVNGQDSVNAWHVAAYRNLVHQAETSGQADSLVPLAKRALDVISDPDERAIIALLAGQLAWRKFNDTDTARGFFARAALVAPQHPFLVDFVRSFGPLPSVEEERTVEAAPASEEPAASAETETTAAPEPEAAPQPEAREEPEAYVEPEPPAEPEVAATPEPEPEPPAQVAEAPAPREEPAPEPVAQPTYEEPSEVPAASLEPVELGDEVFTAEEAALIRAAEQAGDGNSKRAVDAWRDLVARMPDRRYPRRRLRELYEQTNKWSNVADLVKEELRAVQAEDVLGQETLLWQLVEIYRDRLRQPGLVVKTLGTLEELLENAGESSRLLAVVEQQQEQFEAMKRWPDLIGRIRRRAELTEDLEQRKSLYLQAGNLFLEKFNNQAEAIKSYEAVLEVDEYEPTAIAILKDLYARRRDWEKMLLVQQKELALIQDPEERLRQLLDVARTAGTKIKKPSISIDLWTQVLQQDPDNLEALENLEGMQEREKDWSALAGTLERLVETVQDADKRGQYLVKLGLLYSDKLENNRAAIRTWEALYEIDPSNRRAQDALKKLYISEGDMDALEAFYAKQDKWAEFVRVLEREADNADGAQRTRLLLKIAELYRNKLEKPDRAVRALERALGDDSDNLVVAERLLELYEESSDERHMSGPLKIKLRHESDPAARQGLLRRLADLAERVEGNPAQAFEYYREAFDEAYTVTDVRENLERLADVTNSHPALAQSLEAAVAKYGPSTDSLPLRLKLAQVYERHLADLDAALRTNQAILEIDPEEPTALASLERLYLALGREEDLLAVLTTKLQLAADDQERRATQTRIGVIHEQLGHNDDAIRAYEAVLEMGGDDPEVLGALDRMYQRLGRFQDLAHIVRRELELPSVQENDSARTGFLLRLGILKQERLDSAAEAVELFRQVLESDPANEDARARLEGWLDDPNLRLEVATILLPIYERMGADAEQVRCLEIQAEAAEDPRSRVALLLRTGELLRTMGASERAFSVYAQAFREDPENRVAQTALEEIAAIDDRWADFAALYEEAVAKDLPSDQMRQLLTKLARLYDSQLGDAERAIACFQRAVDIDPSDNRSLDALEALYSRDQNWEQLLEVYRSKVELEPDPGAREHLRFKIASLQVDMLARPHDAIATYNDILADDEVNLRAIQALQHLYEASEQWGDLAENLGRQLSLTVEPDEQIQLNLRLGALRLEKLGQAGLAVETYRRVLELDPANPSAMRALEGLLGDEDHQLAVAKILEDIYKVDNNWTKLVSIYEIMVKHSLEPAEKIRLLHRIGELYELAGDEPLAAFRAFGRALQENPGSSETQARLETLSAQLGSYEPLVELYESVVDDIVDDELRIQILARVAQIYEQAIDDSAKAAAAYEKILDIDPANFGAVDALMNVHLRNSNFAELVSAVKRKAEMVDAPEDQKALLKYAATIREGHMEDPEGAIALYQQVLTVDDSDREALDALVRLYVQLGRWEQLKDVYQRQSELAVDPDERRQALYVLGQVYDVELHNTERAIDTYQAVLEIDASDYQAIQALDRLYGQAERWLDQLQILERAVDAVEDEQEQTAFRYRIGNLWESQLGDTVRAIEAYRDVLEHDPEHGPTIAALERIVRGDSESMLAAQVLAPLYEQRADWQRLVEIYEVMVQHMEDPLSKIERLHQVAAVYELQLSEFDKAFGAYARALATDPQSEETVEQLQRLAEVTGDWDTFAALLAEQADKLLDPVVKTQVLIRLARIYEDRLQNSDLAVRRYREVLDSDPENVEAITAMDRIFGEQQRWSELVENLRRQVAITSNEEDVIRLYFRMGQIYQLNTNEPGRAIECYREILNIDPGHQPTLQALELLFAEGERQSEIADILEPIYQQARRWDALVKLGEVKLGATEDPLERVAIVQSVAEICEQKLGDFQQAYVWWLRAYMDEPTNEQVSDELERLAELGQDWAPIVDVGEKILERDVSPETKLAVLSRSARILDQRLGDPGRAIDVFRQVLDIDPENPAALAALDRIYSQIGMAQDLAEILQRRIRITMDGDLLVDLELRLAQVYEGQLGNAEKAIEAYTRALDHDPRNREALEHLEELYMSQYMWQPLFETYQKMADVSNTDEEASGCYQRMAKIAAEALNREGDAIELWNRVLELRGEDALALGELAELHERAGRWEELVDILERQVYVIDDPQERVLVFQTLGRVYGDRLGRERNALDAWLNALELDDRNVITLQALRHIYETSQAWVELIDVLDKLIAVGPAELGDRQLLELYAKAGRIQGEYLMQPEQSIQAWHRVLDLDPGNREALAALEDLYSQQARWSEAIEVLERKSRVVEGDERIDVLMQVASIWEDRVEDKAQAAGAYQEILEVEPSHAAAGEALEQIYRETGEWAALAELLISRADITQNADEKVLVLQSAAKVFEENLDDPDMAFATLQAAFNERYSNEHTSRELERLATQYDKWGDLLNEYNGLVQQLEDPVEQCELWVKIGRWYGEHLNQPEYGIQSLERALELNPESVSALRELASFQRRAHAYDELAETLQRVVPLEQEPADQSRALLELARVQEVNLANVAGAIESYRRVLEIDSDNAAALDALIRLYDQQQSWSELVTVLARRAATTEDPDESLRLKKHIGYVQEANLVDPTAAIETYRDILAREPTDFDALQALERLYLNANRVEQYKEVLLAELDATADVDTQIAIYEKMASALVSLSDNQEEAAEVLEKVIMLDPSRDLTYRQLEELYSGLEKWTELVETYRSHIEATQEPAMKIELLKAMGEVYERQVQDVERAAETYSEILDIDPSNFEAANTLSRLQEAMEDWPQAIETMGRLVELHPDPSARLELLTRMGRVLHEKLLNSDEAELRLNQALSLDPGHVPALIVLADIYKSRADWLKASRTLETASEYSSNRLEKTNLAAEAAFINFEELDNRERAIELFAKTLEYDPEHVRVGRVLVDVYFEEDRFEELDPILDMLTRKVDQLDLDDIEQRELFLRAAKVARQLGNSDKALKQYKRAYDIDSSNHEVLVGMADLLFEREDWDRSFKLYQTILLQHRDTQPPEDTVRVYHRLGTIKNRQNEPRKALNYFEKALDVDPHHEETLASVISLRASANDWEGVIQAKRALVNITPDGDKQFELWRDIGTLYAEKLGNRDKAASGYQSALAIRPDDFPTLHTLLDLFTVSKRWEDTIAIIDRIVEIEQDPIRRSRYNYTAAVLLRDELGAIDDALERFNRVLDDDVTKLKAFQAIDTILTRAKDWKALERAYRRMLKRMPAEGHDALKITLWNNLAEIYRSRLLDYQAAVEAFGVAAKLDPGNIDRHIQMAELYERLMEINPTQYVDASVREHQILIANEPFRYDSYHALFNIYVSAGQVDKAFCMASVLSFLKKATAEEEAYVNQYRRPDFTMARQRLSEDTLRRHVFHPDQDLYLTGILGLIAPAVAAWRVNDLPASINPQENVDISVDPSLFARMAKYVRDVLNVPKPDVYMRPNDPGDLELHNFKRDDGAHPSMVVFQNLLRGKSESHLVFALGRHMMDLYLPHYCYVALGRTPANLKQAFMACLRAVGMPVQGDTAMFEQIAREITGRMLPAAQEQLRSLMQKFIEAGGSTDVKRWAAAVELTGYRVGLLLCQDLRIAGQMISQEQAVIGSAMTPRDKIKELVLYSISEDYFSARRAIGVQVG